MRLGGLVLTGLVTVGLAPAGASAQTAPAVKFVIADDGGASVSGARVRVCPPEESCVTPGRTSVFAGHDLPAGTRVEAISSADAVLRSRVWNGTVRSATPPVLTGSAVAGGAVTLSGGTWTGGWGDEVDRLAIRACRTPDLTDFLCRTHYQSARRPAGAFLIDADLAGFYVGAVHERTAAEALRTVRGLSAWPARGIVRSFSAAVLVAPAPPVPPAVQLRHYATRTARGYGVGTVRCASPCKVRMTVRGAGRRAAHDLDAGKRTALVFPRSAKLRPGLLRVKVTVDGVERANGIVRLWR